MKKIGLALSAVTVSIHGSFHPPVSDAFLRTESQQQTTRLSELLARVKPFSYPAVSAFMTSTYFYFGFARIHSDYLGALVFPAAVRLSSERRYLRYGWQITKQHSLALETCNYQVELLLQSTLQLGVYIEAFV